MSADPFRILGLYLQIKLIDLAPRFSPLPGGVLDEQVALMLRAQQALEASPLDQSSPVQARANFSRSFRLLKMAGVIYEKMAAVRNLVIPGPEGEIPARLYLPGRGDRMPVFVLLHGGGFVIGDLDSADNMARFICRRVPCAVLTVDYRLAPEHPFPAAVEDSFAAVAWCAAHAAELNGDPGRILVGGDSAGGTLSAVVAQMVQQKGGPKLAGQVLFYPSTDSVSRNTPSFQAFGDKPLGLTKQDVDWFLAQYAPDPDAWHNPLVSPLLAEDLHGLAPALVVTAEFDVLRDEGEDYARRLQSAGVPVKLIRCNGMPHGFLSMAGLVRRATCYFDQVVAEIRGLAGIGPAANPTGSG